MVQSTGETLDGPFGPVEGGIVVEEHHSDGSTETKQFAPGYGEFYTAADGEVEALAMAVPPDTASGSQPDALTSAAESASAAVQAALDGDLGQVERLAADLDSALGDLGDAEIPALLRPLLTDGIDSLSTAASDGDEDAATLAAIDVARLVNDLTLRYRPIPEVDLDRIGLWGAQLILDAGAQGSRGHPLRQLRRRLRAGADRGRRAGRDRQRAERDARGAPDGRSTTRTSGRLPRRRRRSATWRATSGAEPTPRGRTP